MKERRKMMSQKKNNYLETMLISESMLKVYSTISNNVSVDKILPFLPLAQAYYLEPVLGRPLLEHLQQEIDDGVISNEDKALLIKIGPPLALFTEYLAIRSLCYSVTEKGITLEASENSRSADRKEIADLIADVKDRAEMSLDLLVKYLCNCSELYELWRPEDICICQKYEQTDGSVTAPDEIQGSIYFPNKIKRNCCN